LRVVCMELALCRRYCDYIFEMALVLLENIKKSAFRYTHFYNVC
jgi:hypothetical protein